MVLIGSTGCVHKAIAVSGTGRHKMLNHAETTDNKRPLLCPPKTASAKAVQVTEELLIYLCMINSKTLTS
jgi:hypothetical protein